MFLFKKRGTKDYLYLKCVCRTGRTDGRITKGATEQKHGQADCCWCYSRPDIKDLPTSSCNTSSLDNISGTSQAASCIDSRQTPLRGQLTDDTRRQSQSFHRHIADSFLHTPQHIADSFLHTSTHHRQLSRHISDKCISSRIAVGISITPSHLSILSMLSRQGDRSAAKSSGDARL